MSHSSDEHSDSYILTPPEPRFRKSAGFLSSSSSESSSISPSHYLLSDSRPLSAESGSYRFNTTNSFPLSLSSRDSGAIDSPYIGPSRPLSLGEAYTLSYDLKQFGSYADKEADDEMHEPEPRPAKGKRSENPLQWSWRGCANLTTLTLVILAILTLFIAYPTISEVTRSISTLGAFNIGGTNASGQVTNVFGRTLIDPDTPMDVYTKQSLNDGSEMRLVFSDEFNTEGRTFYPGDDPYWEAADMHYWGTNNLEWYDPAAITTDGGDLVITLERKETHDLHFQGGMMMTWNKFCFTGGYVEANVSLPGTNNIIGLWPAIWALGNLGRAGYGATLEGTWPYTYDTCDVGTLKNQTLDGQPVAATVNGDTGKGGVLSYLPGQKLSRCTCSGEDHPGPKHSDGTWVGRSAPEIDMFEAQVHTSGEVSQSAQWAPFNAEYNWTYTPETTYIANPSISALNDFQGNVQQLATSVVTQTNQICYEFAAGCYSIYAFEYQPGFENGYITWVSDNKISWTIRGTALGPDPRVQIQERPVPGEPMYLIMNLGMSFNFGKVDLDHLIFPTHMRVDWIRVYQRADQYNVGCEAPGYPTQDYIQRHIEAYTNPNLTTWVDDYHAPWPKNKLLDKC